MNKCHLIFLFIFQLNCFACTAIYRFQLIFVRRRRKQFVLVNQRKRPSDTQMPGQPVVKMLKSVPRVNPVQQNNGSQVTAVQMPTRPDPSKLRQMLSNTGQKMARIGSKTVVMAQNTVRGRQMPQTIVQHRMSRQLLHEVGSSEEDIETEVIDSSMVEVQMETNSNSPQPSAVRNRPMPATSTTTTTVHHKLATIKKEPMSTTSEIKYRQATSSGIDDSLKCDLCPREFHSLRQRQRHRLTHLEQKPVFSCSKCDKRFLDPKEKGDHERIAHGIRRSESAVRVKQEKKIEGIDDIGDGGTGGNEEVLMEIAVEEEVQDGNLYVHDA